MYATLPANKFPDNSCMNKDAYIERSINELFMKTAPLLCFGGTVIFVLLSALDYVSTPGNFRVFLLYRAANSSFLLSCFFILRSNRIRRALHIQFVLGAAVFASAVTVELMILKTGGHTSSYYVGMSLVGIWVVSFLPVRMVFSLVLMLIVYGTYLFPILATEEITDFRTFFTENAFLLALLSSSLVLRYLHFSGLVNELGLKYDLEAHKNLLESQVRDRTAKLSQSIVSLKKEIAERKRVETAIQKASKEWRTTFDSTTDVIMMLDVDYKIIRVNKAASHFCTQPFDDLIGTSLFQHFPVDAIRHETGAQSVLKQSMEHEEGNIYLSDRKLWASISVDPIREDDGRILGAVFIMRDITERIKAEEEQRKLQAEFQQMQKMDSIGRLAGGIAHDFNNILSAIIGFSHVALMKLPDNHPAAEAIKIIYESGERAAALTRQLLAFSRKQVLEMKVVNLNTIIESLAKMLHRVIGENIVLDLNLQNPMRNIVADKGQMEQVLMNLLVNARDAMRSGGRVTITTSELFLGEDRGQKIAPGYYVALSVADTGTGMSRQVQERIFEPFYTTKGMGKGTGLGLSTVYGIIKQHNGHIAVNSEQGRGTTFRILFPTIDRETDKINDRKHPSLTRGTETVLVVDDEPSIRKLLVETLRPLGYKVLDAPSGEDAVKVSDAYQGDIHLLVTDVIMPGVNGVQLAEALQQRRPLIKVIFVSGYTDEAIIPQDVLDKKMVFLQKPLTPVLLTNKIREMLSLGA
jgi:two-component system cell cycle sensor histidine kinase/response regulator CckA